MKSKRLLTLTPIILASGLVFAQTDPALEEEEVLELSPFVVTEDSSSGYYASQTLAGSRLKTDVADVASSIQILTEEFLEDVGADDVNDLFLYTTSTESAGLNGNFTDYAVGATSLGDEAFRVDPQGAQRVRGLARADITRNYFLTRLPNDRYNTERVEINRGANSILFGLGSPAGIANTSFSQARYANFGEIRHRFDSEGSNRLEFDGNVEIFKDRLAVRVAYLHDDTKYYQEPAFEEDDRLYFALHARPWRGAAVRGFFENGSRDANRPSLIFPASTMEFWFDSNPVIRQQIQSTLDANAVLDINGNPLSVPGNTHIGFDPFLYDLYGRNENNILNATDVNDDGTVDAADDLARIQALNNAYIFPSNNAERYVSHPNVSRQLLKVFEYNQPEAGGAPMGATGVQSNLNGRRWLPDLSTIPYSIDPSGNGQFSNNYMASIQPWRDRDPVRVPRSIDNLEIFDFTQNLLSGESGFQNDDWSHANLAVEQLFFDDYFGIEIAFDQQNYERETFVPFQGFTGVFIDLMQSYLGEPNPNYGRPFVQARTNKIDIEDERDTVRVTAFARFIPAEVFTGSKLAGWLGEHTFTGLYNRYSQDDSRTTYNQYYTDQFAGSTFRNNDTQISDSNRRFNYAVYIGDQDLTTLGSVDDVRLERMTTQQLWDPGQTTTITDIDPDTGELFRNTLQTEVFMDGFGTNEQEVKSQALVWNSFLLDRNLVGLVGWRRDQAYAASFDAFIDPDSGLPVLDDMRLIGGGDTVTEESLSWSIVGHTPERWMPEGTGLSFHYGYSENFTLGNTSRDLNGNKVAAPSGETKEYGVTLKLFDGKLYARLNWFETNLLNRPLQGSSNLYDTFINRILLHSYAHLSEAEIVGFIPESIDPETEEVDPGTPNFDLGMQALEQLRPIIPDAILTEAGLIGFDGTGNVAQDRLDIQFGDTEDVTAEGFELELTYNPMRNWRMTMNVAKQETVISNYSPRLRQLLEITDPILSSTSGLIKDLRFFPNYDTEPFQYITGEAVDVNSFGLRSEQLVYNEYRNTLAQQGRVSNEQRKWRVNFITNYSFREGILKGFGLGAAYRWQDGAVIGYPTEIVDGAFVSDIDNPHVAPSETTIDAWIRYRTKIWNDKVDWMIEFRVQNLNTDADELIPVVADTTEAYNVAVWRSGPPRIWRVTNSFKF